MNRFMAELERRLDRDGFGSAAAKARQLGVDPATWSRARRGMVNFSPQIIRAGLARYPELAFFLSDREPERAA